MGKGGGLLPEAGDVKPDRLDGFGGRTGMTGGALPLDGKGGGALMLLEQWCASRTVSGAVGYPLQCCCCC